MLWFQQLTRQTADIYSDWLNKMRESGHSTMSFSENKSTSSILLHVARLRCNGPPFAPCLLKWLSFVNASSSDSSRNAIMYNSVSRVPYAGDCPCQFCGCRAPIPGHWSLKNLANPTDSFYYLARACFRQTSQNL